MNQDIIKKLEKLNPRFSETDESIIESLMSQVSSESYERGKEEGREELKKIISKHNARILNEFQLQGKPDMPFIAYDERVCLIPAIEIATKETLKEGYKKGLEELNK